MEEDAQIKLRIEKQSYLRSEIIEEGYNPIAFQNFVEALKTEGFLKFF